MSETGTETGKVQNVSGEDLLDAWSGGRLVEAGQAIDVPLEQVYGYTQQGETWSAYDDAARAAHQTAVQARAALEAGTELQELHGVESGDDGPPQPTAAQLVDELIPSYASDQLQILIEAEQGRPRPRTTVLAAAQDRLDELAAGESTTSQEG